MHTAAPQTGLSTPITPENTSDFLVYSDRNVFERIRESRELLGPRSSYANVLSFVRILNFESGLHLDEIEQKVIALHLFKLKDSVRYRGDVHLLPSQTDYVAQHVARVIFKSDKIFKQIEPNDASKAELRRNFIMGALLHDLGEVVCEFYSVAQENDRKVTQRLSKDFQVELEDKIADFANRLALCAALTGKHHVYFRTINKMRRDVGLNDDGSMSMKPLDAYHALKEFIKKFDVSATFELTSDQMHEVEDRLNSPNYGLNRFYRYAEQYQGVGGSSIKVAEIIDGNEIFVEWVRMNVVMQDLNVVPYGLSTSHRQIGAAYARTEASLTKLFNNTTETRIQRELALAHKRAAYESLIDHLSHGPSVLVRDSFIDLDRVYTTDPEALKDGKLNPTRLKAYHDNLGYEAAHAENDFLMSRDMKPRLTISSRTMLLLYMAAWACDDYIPDSMPLVLKQEIPHVLKPYVALLDSIEDSGFIHVERSAYKIDNAEIRKAGRTILEKQDDIQRFFRAFHFNQTSMNMMVHNYAEHHGLKHPGENGLRFPWLAPKG